MSSKHHVTTRMVLSVLQGSYSDEISTAECKPCTRCKRSELMVETCNYRADAICVGKLTPSVAVS